MRCWRIDRVKPSASSSTGVSLAGFHLARSQATRGIPLNHFSNCQMESVRHAQPVLIVVVRRTLMSAAPAPGRSKSIQVPPFTRPRTDSAWLLGFASVSVNVSRCRCASSRRGWSTSIYSPSPDVTFPATRKAATSRPDPVSSMACSVSVLARMLASSAISSSNTP